MPNKIEVELFIYPEGGSSNKLTIIITRGTQGLGYVFETRQAFETFHNELMVAVNKVWDSNGVGIGFVRELNL